MAAIQAPPCPYQEPYVTTGKESMSYVQCFYLIVSLVRCGAVRCGIHEVLSRATPKLADLCFLLSIQMACAIISNVVNRCGLAYSSTTDEYETKRVAPTQGWT